AWLLPLLGAVGLESVIVGTRARRLAALTLAGAALVFGVTVAGCASLVVPHLARLAYVPEIAGPAAKQLLADGVHLTIVATLLCVVVASLDRSARVAISVLAATLLFDGARTGRLFVWTTPRASLADATPIADALRAEAPSRFVRFPPTHSLPLHKNQAGYLYLSKAMTRRLDWDVDVGEGVDALTQYADLQVGEVTALRDALLYTNAYFVLSEQLATDHQVVANDATLPKSFLDRLASGRLVEELHTEGMMSATLLRDTNALPRAAMFQGVTVAADTVRSDVALSLLRDNELHRVANVDAHEVLDDGRVTLRDVHLLLSRSRVAEIDLHAIPPTLPRATAAEIVAATPTMRVVRAHADAPSLLVLAEVFYPGWRAELDGRPVPILRASFVGRGVAIPPGDHTVTFRYRSRAVSLGATLSILTWSAMIALLVLDRRRKA
ncbi:MAG: hypothetical protein ACHREM_25095, partial [Polyangiales bacterium]